MEHVTRGIHRGTTLRSIRHTTPGTIVTGTGTILGTIVIMAGIARGMILGIMTVIIGMGHVGMAAIIVATRIGLLFAAFMPATETRVLLTAEAIPMDALLAADV